MRRSQITVQTLAAVYDFAADGGVVQSYPTSICPPNGAVITDIVLKFITGSGNALGTDLDVTQGGVSLLGGPLSAIGLVPAGTIGEYTNVRLQSDGSEVQFVIGGLNAWTQGKLIVEVKFNADSE